MKCMILFTKHDFIDKMLYVGDGRKKRLKTRKKFPVWFLSHPSFYDMEADCFPMSENAENKADLP